MNEFSRLYRLDSLSGEPRRVEIAAEAAEREALARRFGLVAVEALAAEAELRRSGGTVTALGRLRGKVVQACVATADPVEEAVDETFRIDFRPPPEPSAEEEIELGEEELDIVFYEGGAVDLGEAAAQTLALSLDPYPRSPAAEAALREAGVKSDEEARTDASPFAALKRLKGE